MKNSIKVGIFSLATFILMFFTIIYVGKCTASRGSISFRVQFDDLDDLKNGALVKFAGGLPVGYVKEIYRVGSKAELILWIEKDFPVTKNSGFVIRSAGMLGEKYIQLIYQDGPQAPPNYLFQGTNAASLGSALVMLQQFVDEAKKTVSTLNAILGSGDQSILKNTSSSFAGIVQKLNALLSSSNENITQTFDNLKNLSVNLQTTINSLNQLIAKINSGEGTLGMLLTDKKLQKEITDLISNLKQASEKLNKSSFLNPSQDGRPRW